MTATQWIPGDPLYESGTCWSREIFDLLPDPGSGNHVGCPICRTEWSSAPHYQHVTPEEVDKILRTCFTCGCEHGIACPTMRRSWEN